MHGLSLVVRSGGCSLVVEPGLPVVVASHVAEALGQMGFSSCSSWAQELRVMVLVASQHVGSSQTRDRTCVS